MKTRLASLAMLATSVAALTAFSASADQANSVRPILDKFPVRSAYHAVTDKIVRARKPAAQITQWNGSFTDHHNTKRTFRMIGTDPTNTNTNTSIPFEVVPVVFKYPSFNKMKFNPKKDKYSDGETVLQNFLNSPLLDSNVDFQSGGVDFGKGQYIDSYQRANFYGNNVQNETNYHVALGSPTVLKPLKITVQAGQGVVETNPFGSQKIGTYGFNAMDQQINTYIQNHSQVTPDQFVFFISHNIFLTSGGCCIGGYHFSTGTAATSQTYGYTTLVTEAGSFSQDVSAASHEIGEWTDDPMPGTNNVGCNDNGWLENGDPLEGRANYGGFPYTDHGFTYNLQDLVFIDYFGAPDTWPVNKLKSFNKLEANYCPGQ
jgi:hypothetical protein